MSSSQRRIRLSYNARSWIRLSNSNRETESSSWMEVQKNRHARAVPSFYVPQSLGMRWRPIGLTFIRPLRHNQQQLQQWICYSLFLPLYLWWTKITNKQCTISTESLGFTWTNQIKLLSRQRIQLQHSIRIYSGQHSSLIFSWTKWMAGLCQLFICIIHILKVSFLLQRIYHDNETDPGMNA